MRSDDWARTCGAIGRLCLVNISHPERFTMAWEQVAAMMVNVLANESTFLRLRPLHDTSADHAQAARAEKVARTDPMRFVRRWAADTGMPELGPGPPGRAPDRANNHPFEWYISWQDDDPDEDRRKAAERILCSPGTTYTAMAATMYTIRATLAEEEYALFESLTTTGVSVTKHPFRSGRPSQKTFQLSLVQGDMYLYMYLTWKGKRTSIQGVELASVIRISRGRDTDVLRRTGKVKDEGRYLSLVTQDRSLDLCFDDEEQRELWWRTMTALVDVEREVRAAASDGADSPPPPPPNAPKPP